MSQRKTLSTSKQSSDLAQDSYPYHRQPPGFHSIHSLSQSPAYSPPPNYGPGPPLTYGPNPPSAYMEYHAMGPQSVQFPMHYYGPMPPMGYAPYPMYPPASFPPLPFPGQANSNISDASMDDDEEDRFETISADLDDADHPATRRRIDSTPEQVASFPDPDVQR